MLLVDIPLGGAVVPWCFPGSAGLGRWLSDQPWLNEGGICAVIGAPGNDPSLFIAALQRATHAAHAGNGDLSFIEVESGQAQDSPLIACLCALGLEWSAGKLRAAEDLFKILRTRSALFIVRLTGAERLEWWDELNDFTEIYHKRYSSSPFAALILSSAPLIGITPKFDFQRGWPIAIDLWSDGLEVRERWTGYQYYRIVWEAAGSPTIVEELEQRTRRVKFGDDDALEQQFNAHARDRLRSIELPPDAWTDLVTTYGQRRPGVKSDQRGQLHALWWIPPHSIGSRLAPWACRAALLQKSEPGPADWKLRNELICEPLAHELFALCQQGEALIRTRIFRSGLKQSPSEEACKLLKIFQEDKNGNTVYPLNHPAPPNDAWAFASLGEVIKAASERLPVPFWDLLLLRNSIGHGHFVGWKQVTTLIDFMRVVQ